MDRLKFFIEAAGAQYLGVDKTGSVLFRDCQTGKTLSLYLNAVHGVADITMALKRCHEQAREEGWQSRI